MPLVFDSHNNKFCAYIKQCKQSTDNTVHFCNSSCYSASEKRTSAKDLNSKTNKNEVLPFEIGERLFYTNEGHTTVVQLADIEEDVGATKFVIELPGNCFITTTCKHLRPPSQPDIARIPVSQNDFRQDSNNLSKEQLSELANLKALSPEQQELISYHHCLHHPSFLSCIAWHCSA